MQRRLRLAKGSYDFTKEVVNINIMLNVISRVTLQHDTNITPFAYLHGVADGFAFHQNFAQVFGAEHITQGGLCKEASGAVCILHIGDGHGGIVDSEVNYSIHGHSHAVLCQDLEIYRAQSYNGYSIRVEMDWE